MLHCSVGARGAAGVLLMSRPHRKPSQFSFLLQEEEDGSEDEGDSKTQFAVTVQPDLNVFSFLGHMDEEVDGFISPVDDLSPSKSTIDMRLSNLHSATT